MISESLLTLGIVRARRIGSRLVRDRVVGQAGASRLDFPQTRRRISANDPPPAVRREDSLLSAISLDIAEVELHGSQAARCVDNLIRPGDRV